MEVVFSLVVGTVLGTARVLASPAARVPLIGFIELFRGLPVVITIFYVWQVLPEIGVSVALLPGDDGLWYVVIGLTLYNSVILAEILRAGVMALPRGQAEAGLAIGMTPRQTMFNIQLPQAFRTMLPALISPLVVMLKELVDLFRDRRTVAISLLFGPLLVPALILGLGKLVATRISTQLEKPLDVPMVGAEHAPNLVAWLASEECTFTTGAVHDLSGGRATY